MQLWSAAVLGLLSGSMDQTGWDFLTGRQNLGEVPGKSGAQNRKTEEGKERLALMNSR